jgi:type 1 fimbria pilin
MKHGTLGLRKVFAMLGSLLLGATISHSAYAVCEAVEWEIQFPIPDTRLVANSADVGEFITPWIYSPQEEFIKCGSSNSYGHYVSYEGTLNEVSTLTTGGATYGVFATTAPGIGFILAAEMEGAPGSRASVPIRGKIESGRFDVGDHVWVKGAIALRFVKTGETKDGTYDIALPNAIWVRHYQVSMIVPKFTLDHMLAPMTLDVVHVPLCHVQSGNVNTGIWSLDRFEKQGSVSAWRPYRVDMNCEAGAGKVNYYLEQSSSAVLDAKNGILEVDGGAKGIGLQLLDGAGNPVSIGRSYPFGSSSADGLRSETFGTRYIRTAASAGDLEAGPANANIRYRIDYP